MNIGWGALTAIGALATPLVVLVLSYMFTKKQSRSEGLLNARFEYYDRLAPQLNTLMCYGTVIGDWSTHSPDEMVELKRSLECALATNSRTRILALNESDDALVLR